jgi:tRNA (Thr-GGU) A37 N-methylase
MAIEGTRLVVEGLDAIDGTPILDIKPHISSFGPKGETNEPAWVSELMENYWE